MAIAIATLLAFGIMAPTAVHAASTSQLTVTSKNTSGTAISGYYTVLSSGGVTVSTGFRPTYSL